MMGWLRRLAARSITAIAGDDEGLVQFPVLAGPARGLRFALDLQRGGEAAYITGRYEPRLARALLELVAPGCVVWDCGTHIGYFTALLARRTAPGAVIAFDADAVNAARTQHNARINRLDHVTVVHAAIAAESGEGRLVGGQGPLSHLHGMYVGAAPRGEAVAGIAVRTISIDDALRDKSFPRPDVIKLDIEGAEAEALAATRLLGVECRPVIAIELHNPEADRALWEFCARVRYSITSVASGERIVRAADVHGTLVCVPSS